MTSPSLAMSTSIKSRRLDFVLAGAAKCGTTSLFEYIRHHPGIFVPLQKELPLFHCDADAEDVARFINEEFSAARPDQKIGKITPQYLNFEGVEKRLVDHNPEIRVVFLLRNPIDRGFSHYKMLKKHDPQMSSFGELVRRKLGGKHLGSDQEKIFGPGRYFEHINKYVNSIGRNQVYIMFAENLEVNALHELSSLFDFLGVKSDWAPSNINKRYHTSRERIRFVNLINMISANKLYRKVFRGIVSDRRRAFLTYKLKQVLAIRNPATLDHGKVRKDLVEYYRDDVRSLEALLGVKVPWAEFGSR